MPLHTDLLDGPLAAVSADALILPVHGDAPAAYAEAFGDALSAALADARTSKRPVTILRDGDGPRRLVVVDVPDGPNRTAPGHDAWRLAAAAGVQAARAVHAERIVLALGDLDPDIAGALVEGARLGGYRFDTYKTADAPPAFTLALHAETDTAAAHDTLDAALVAADARAEATNVARDLVNLSPDEKVPVLLADRMAEIGEVLGLHVEIWGMDRIRAEGFGGLLGVNRGSLDEARFVVVEHEPDEAANAAPVVLVGKGVTFDTGGLSLKPTLGSMDKMKADMGGAAAVFGALYGAAELGLPLRVIGLIPMTDNRPGGRAVVPGDVLHMHGGTTVEVMNTDAEGRLILADALSYARSLAPRLVVDVATLTGAQGVALGDRVAGLVVRMGDEALAETVRQAGEETGDLAWPLPLFPHFKEHLKSPVADLSNVGGPMAGTITAAAFLEHFTRTDDGEPAYPWIHLDIARPAFLDSASGYRPAGGTGFGVRLLLRLLETMV
ncbi:MAG TPA: leucyl aminopeptidase [Rubricoccaceae bacterium]|jgi:leucyl aminopeptidase